MPINMLPDGFERRHIFFDAGAHPDYRESLAYLLPLPQHGLGIIWYTWVHALGEDGKGRAGAMMVVYGPAIPKPIFAVADQVFVSDRLSFEDWTVGPASLTLTDDMMSGSLGFHTDDISFDVTYRGLNPSFDFRDNRNGCPAWLATDRTEQGLQYTGTLRVGDLEIDIDDFGHRDHSWGNRDWGGPTHWKWWNIMGPDDIAIHAMELQAFGTTTLHGYVQKDGAIGTLLTLDPHIEFDDRFMHTRIAATLTDDEGRTTEVVTTSGADLSWPVSDFLTLHEASMHATIDGVPGVAYMEIAWPPAYAAHHRRRDDSHSHGAAGLTIDKA